MQRAWSRFTLGSVSKERGRISTSVYGHTVGTEATAVSGTVARQDRIPSRSRGGKDALSMLCSTSMFPEYLIGIPSACQNKEIGRGLFVSEESGERVVDQQQRRSMKRGGSPGRSWQWAMGARTVDCLAGKRMGLDLSPPNCRAVLGVLQTGLGGLGGRLSKALLV